jgi:hypothetical protein
MKIEQLHRESSWQPIESIDESVNQSVSQSVSQSVINESLTAIASTVVLTTLLYGSFSVRLTPEVWQCVRSSSDFGFFGEKFSSTNSAQSCLSSQKRTFLTADI